MKFYFHEHAEAEFYSAADDYGASRPPNDPGSVHRGPGKSDGSATPTEQPITKT